MKRYDVFQSEGGYRYASGIWNGNPIMDSSLWFATKEEALAAAKKAKEDAMKFGIVYGAEGRSDYTVDGPYDTLDEAREAYDPNRRITYMDDVIGGAEIVELEAGYPVATIETLAGDEHK
jgi:hypothetical protein